MEISVQEFRDTQALVRELCGLVLTDDKTYLVRTRLETVVKAHGCGTFGEYLRRVQQVHSVAMRDELVEALTTGETSFYRDTHPFEEFRRRILPSLAEAMCQGRPMRASLPLARFWSAGCSTGQEAYSLAIVIREFILAHPKLPLRPQHFQILATDVSNRSLNVAREGRYTTRELDRGLLAEQRDRYFQHQGDYWIANEELRRAVEFRKLNLIDRLPSLGPFAAIFCRNVLMYFDVPTRQRVCDQFFQLLASGGLLIVGAAESLYGLTTPFDSEQIGSTTVYRKMTREDER